MVDESYRFAIRICAGHLLPIGFGKFLMGGKRGGNFTKSPSHRFFKGYFGLVPLRHGSPILILQSAGSKERACESPARVHALPAVVNSESCGLTPPIIRFRKSWEKIRLGDANVALAAMRFCSASRKSGRRSSRADGNPAGTCGGSYWSASAAPRHDRPWIVAKQQVQCSLLSYNLSSEIRDDGCDV